jgi:hypothetical protein
MTLEQALSARQPPTDWRHEGRIEEQMHGDADRGARPGHVIAGPHGFRVGPFPRLDRDVEMTGRIGNVSEECKIGGTEETVRVRVDEEVVGV